MDDCKNAPEVPPGPSTSSQDFDCNLQEVQNESTPLLQLQLTLTDRSWFTALRKKMAPPPLPPPQQIISSSMKVCQTLMSEKLKASNFPISSISIGAWKRVSGRVEGELAAKIYYAKRKLVWEFIDGSLKSKMEISFSDITALRDVILPDQPAILEIELSIPPLFFRELAPQPRKHTNWQQASDFTDGQALLFRRHFVTFPPGALDKHYEKLLLCDPNLMELRKWPFPRHISPHFDVAPAPLPVYNISEEPTLVFRHQPQLHYPIAPMPPPPPAPPLPPLHQTLNPLITTQELGFVNFPRMDEMGASNLSIHNQPTMWEDDQTAAGFLNNIDPRFVGSPPEEMQLQQQPPYHHFSYDELPLPPPPMAAPEECYGCDVDFLPPFYPDFDPINTPTTSYDLSADDHRHHHLMFPPPPPPPPQPQPHFQAGRSRGFGYDSGSGVEGLEQILYSNHGVHDDHHVQVQRSRRDL